MKTAFAVSDGGMAVTLGSAGAFVLLEEDRQPERVVCCGNIPQFLKRYQTGVLVCNGIGNCMKDLLTSMNITVIPGVSGGIDEVIGRYLAGSLAPGEKYSCADHGRTCGECPGTF
jgi:predicted Fe-Mo cluster-binding NifX family protein